MQVVQRCISFAVAVWLGTIHPATAQDPLSEIRPRPLASAIAAVRQGNWDAAQSLAARDVAVAADIIEWQRLLAGQGTFDEVIEFLQRRPDWPSLDTVRRASEDAVADASPENIRAFFEEVPPQTPSGVLSYAKSLIAQGNSEQAQKIILKAWVSLSMDKDAVDAFLEAHNALLKSRAAQRLDSMLWKGWIDNARVMFPFASSEQRALAEARIALQQRATDVDALLAKVPPSLKLHPGLARDRFEWRVRKGRWEDAKDLLIASSKSKAALGNPFGWSNRRRGLARDELREGDPKRAYELAANHHLEPGSHYADLEWLAGYIALTKLDDPKLALSHFKNHDAAVASPISKGRAGYWQGRAYLALGDVSAADQAFTSGAAHQTSFYGLLAAEAAGLPFDVGLADVPKESWNNSPLQSDSLFQAGMLLAVSGERTLAERFLVHLAEQLGEHDAALLGQAAIDLKEPHLAVMIGKAIARRGVTAPVPYYPLHPLADQPLPVPKELALAIARRESEFDPVVVSGVGAQGLMQLMPATAREVAEGLGLADAHSTARLTQDPAYNALLGTQFLADLIKRFDDNIIMVSAAYNAGPSRPNRWMQEYGDPRGQDIDAMIDWIEGIPFRETRNYVMRVSESLPIFRARLGQDPLPVPFSKELLRRR